MHVFPTSEFFSEIRDCYQSAARRIPWMSTDELSNWTVDRLEWGEQDLVLIFWGRMPSVPKHRRATLVFRYTESVGDPELLIEAQRDLMTAFAAQAHLPDLLLAGCPAVANYWSQLCRAVAVAPMGYEPTILGEPDWSTKKCFDVAYRGHYVDRRTWLLRRLQRHLQNRFHWIHSFGLNRKRELDACRADLYIGHSVEYGFPGARLWQSIASSAALLTEPRDVWPAVPGRHYVELPLAKHDDWRRFVVEVSEIVNSAPLDEISRTANRELSTYTIDRCMSEFIVPAVSKVSA
jgi:hypothetical protein